MLLDRLLLYILGLLLNMLRLCLLLSGLLLYVLDLRLCRGRLRGRGSLGDIGTGVELNLHQLIHFAGHQRLLHSDGSRRVGKADLLISRNALVDK